MSFILDALRKSEHDRQRQTGPGLAEVPMAPSRPKKNVWATAAVVLLIVNLLAVGVLLLRRASHEAPTATPADTPTAPAAAAPAAARQTPPTAAPPSPQASVTQALPQPVLQPRPTPAAPAGRNPLASEVAGGSQGLDADMAAHAASVPQQVAPAVSRATTIPATGGSVGYQPIPEAAVARAVAAETPSAPPQHSSLPTADEVSAGGGVPRLHLDLHVFSAKPQERFIFVNSHKYREGDTLQEGPVVEQITQSGAVLNYRGSRFLLTRD